MFRNVDYNLNRAQAFADNPVYSNLLGLREGVPVGNWRDSNEGLGYGNYPFDVNSSCCVHSSDLPLEC